MLPLSVLTTEVEAINMNGRMARIKEDLAWMNRLVERLLQVAHLDNVALDVSGIVDLNQVAADVVAQMAPLAIAEGKSLALGSCVGVTEIHGNPHAISDALRNLVRIPTMSAGYSDRSRPPIPVMPATPRA